MVLLPPRYEAKHPLGKGGGGEVWAVRDRVSGRMLALKALAVGAGTDERMALVREAMALSGLEGLGVPRVVAFGALPESGRRYLVRELVPGESLEDALETRPARDLLRAIAGASQKLTVLHRAGLLHGDIKPANIIVDDAGKATLVDLGLAVSWRARRGTQAEGLTPKYAAPELLRGEPLTVRAEVYSLGATLAEVLKRAPAGDAEASALEHVARRAMAEDANARFPSVDEFASALQHAAHLAPSSFGRESHGNGAEEPAWPVLGLEGVAQALSEEVAQLSPGDALAIVGPRGSGRTTLALRLAWTLGIEGHTVARIDAPPSNILSVAETTALELDAVADAELPSAVVIVDDVHLLGREAREALLRASRHGARIVGVGAVDKVAQLCDGQTQRFDVPKLDERAAEELVLRAMPSLPKALVNHLIARTARVPGALRAALRALGDRPVVSVDEIDAVLRTERAAPSTPTAEAPASVERGERFLRGERLLDTGRIDEAEQEFAQLGQPTDVHERVRLAVAEGRIALGRGDPTAAAAKLDAIEPAARDASAFARAWKVARARAHLRSGAYAEAAALAEGAIEGDDARSADALSVRGIALIFMGNDEQGRTELTRSLDVARQQGDRRLEAVALGAMAIVHQRAGENGKAREAYEQSLAAAEDARDVGTVALTRLNLAGLARAEGDLALSLTHLEAAVDMGRRAGGLLALQGALLNLANLDLYLGRYARARASIDSLAAARAQLSPINEAMLVGFEAELAARTGDVPRASELYEESARIWETTGRPLDAAESRLEALLAQADARSTDAGTLGRGLAKVRAMLGPSGFGEHEALEQIVAGAIALLGGDEGAARQAFDRANDRAAQAGRREWQWRSLEARARLSILQGNKALARRDVDTALAILEETAAKLPRDLREVFWNDPRRRALQDAHGASHVTIPSAKVSAMRRPLPAEDRLVRILEITRELASIHDIGRLLAKVTDHAIALLGAERGFVVLTNAHGELETHTSRDRRGDDPHAQFSHSVAEKVVRTGEPVIATSARDDARLAEAVSVHQLMIQSIACVPISGEQEAIGALYLETRLRPGARFTEELPTLAAFADQAAIAITNARLIAENRQRADELARANQELAAAHDKLSELLGRRTEQLEVTRRNLKEVRAQLRSHFGYAGLVGTSAAMRKLYAVMDRIKDTDVPVLVTGESGTGKEVVAKAIHAAGARAKKPFLGVNCGAIPANLLESELFGHVRGAFTGAERDRKGLFREAEQGTLLLDEIGEIPIKMQAGLLRVLQERSVRPVGGVKEESCDVRIIAATNRDLSHMVAEGTFREDLFYRLHVVELRIPPLRERSEDILPLIDHFLSIFAARYRRERKSVGREALRRLSGYDWPGNVRQLEHVLLNAWLMSDTNELQLEDFELPDTGSIRPAGPPSAASSAGGASGANSSSSASTTRVVARNKAEFKDSERQRILDALAECNWNRVQAARLVGVPRRTFYRRLKEFGII